MPFFFWPVFVARGLMLLMFFITNSFFYCFLIILSYILEGVGNPAYGGIMKEVYPEKKRAEAMGYVRVFVYGAMMTSTLLFGFLLDHFGRDSYRFLFPLGGLFGMASVRSFRRIKIRREKISARHKFRPFILSTELWDLGSYNYIVGIAEKKEVQNFIGMHFTLMGIRGIIGPFVGVKLFQVIGLENTFLVSFILAIAGFFVLLKLKNVQNNLSG